METKGDKLLKAFEKYRGVLIIEGDFEFASFLRDMFGSRADIDCIAFNIGKVQIFRGASEVKQLHGFYVEC